MEFAKDYKLTDKGRAECEWYIRELQAKRKEILDARLDTAEETVIPTVEDIESDIAFTGLDEEGSYYNSWGVTDTYDADAPLSLQLGVDFTEA